MREFLLNSIPFVVLGLMAAAIYYLSIRITWAFGVSKLWTMLTVSTVVIGSFVVMMVIMKGNYTTTTSHILSNASIILIGIMIFAVCITMLLDGIRIFTKIQPRTFGFLALGLTLTISAYSLWNANNTKVYHREITLPNLVQPLRIAHLSDTHFGHYWGESKAQELADLISAESVDAVVITGDMFDGRIRLNSDIVQPFTRLGVPVYFSEGNHDGYSGSRDIKDLLTQNGVIVLENELVELKGLQIIGLDYLLPDNSSTDNFNGAMSNRTMQGVLPTLGIDTTRASILLHHNPVGANYAAENGINLYLAGHTHAGQLFPSTLFAAMMFKYNKGLYKYDDNMQIYVSQGTGTFGPPMRLGTHSELTIIDLRDSN